MTTLKISLSLLLLVLLTGCATKVVYITPELPLPGMPVTPTVFATELECLTPESYEAIVVRETRLKNHIDVLRDIIATHNLSAAPDR